MIIRVALVAGLLGATLAVPAYADAPSWTASIAPTATNRTATGLQDIACPSATFCVGINAGPPAVVELRDGRPTAKALRLPVDSGGFGGSALNAIACSTPTWCVAVGQYETYTNRVRPLFETYRDGRWQASTVAGQSHGLQSVACNVSTCLATGSWFGGYFDDTVLLARDASGTWTLQSADVTYGETIADPACTPGYGPCFAQVFHQAQAFPVNRTFLYRSGSAWRAVSFPGPDGADLTTLELGAMACPALDYCVTVGSYRDLAAPYEQHLVAETFADGELSAAEIAMPAAVTDEQNDLIATDTACSSRRSCVAAGSFRFHDGLVLSRSGSAWTARTAPVPAGESGSTAWIADVACSTAGVCAGVGSVGGSGRRPLAEDWADDSWSPTLVALPTDHDSGQLASVSCRGLQCVAAGGADGDPLLAVRASAA
jgi:hypothetical protein